MFVTRASVDLSARDYGRAKTALLTEPDDGWERRGLCIGKDPNWWFTDDESDKQQRLWMETQARAVCAGCPVRMSCLNYGIRHREDFGMWGGYNSEELRRMRITLHVPSMAPASLIPVDRAARVEWLIGRGWTVTEIAHDLGIDETEVATLARRREEQSA